MIQDNCGVFGITSTAKTILNELYTGVFYLQHRGQQYCGLATTEGKKIKIRTHRGLVRETFAEDLDGLDGRYGIGHTSLKDRQPILLDSKLGEFAICFSGRILNTEQLVQKLKEEGHSFHSTEDLEIIAKLIAQGNDFVDGITKMAEAIKGSYALLILTKDGIYAARDKRGFRPLILGKRDGSIAVASESCSFNNLGIMIERDVKPGEIVFLKDGMYETKKIIKADFYQYCAFEWIYTANLASIIDGLNVDIARRNLGSALANSFPVKADVVAAVPSSGIGHAIGYAQASGIPYDQVFVKYEYASRSYTQPTQKARDLEAKIKLIPIGPKIKGKRVVIVDDSIVRGTQFKNDLVVKLKLWGVKEIHARIACPPLKGPCRYGRSTRGKKELIGSVKSIEEIRKYIGLTSLAYNSVENVVKAIGKPEKDLCLSCWTENYKE